MIVIAATGLLLIGAGCASQKTEMKISAQKQSFVERRTGQPPTPPENIPAPTPVKIVE